MFGHKAGPSKVYEFGCGAPTEGAEYVDAQILLAHRYRNRLVEIELERRRKVREATSAHSGEVAALEAKTGDLATTLEAIPSVPR